jgi:hypothetical protein
MRHLASETSGKVRREVEGGVAPGRQPTSAPVDWGTHPTGSRARGGPPPRPSQTRPRGRMHATARASGHQPRTLKPNLALCREECVVAARVELADIAAKWGGERTGEADRAEWVGGRASRRACRHAPVYGSGRASAKGCTFNPSPRLTCQPRPTPSCGPPLGTAAARQRGWCQRWAARPCRMSTCSCCHLGGGEEAADGGVSAVAMQTCVGRRTPGDAPAACLSPPPRCMPAGAARRPCCPACDATPAGLTECGSRPWTA